MRGLGGGLLPATGRALFGYYGPGAQLIAFLLVILAVLFAVVALVAYTGTTLAENEKVGQVQPTATRETVLDGGAPDDTNPVQRDDHADYDARVTVVVRPRMECGDGQVRVDVFVGHRRERGRKPAKSYPVPNPNSAWWS